LKVISQDFFLKIGLVELWLQINGMVLPWDFNPQASNSGNLPWKEGGSGKGSACSMMKNTVQTTYSSLTFYLEIDLFENGQ